MDGTSGSSRRPRFAGHATIHPSERDRSLDLSHDTWPTELALPTTDMGWTLDAGSVSRELSVPSAREGEKATDLREVILRFPSAPIYGVNRVHVHQRTIAKSEGFHSLRLLSKPRRRTQPPKTVYLFHNGLNEIDRQPFYYRLAAWLLNAEPDAVCLLRPFPGHLSRFPFHGLFAEQPLDRYLLDSADLFRQFLRYMIESQWILSAIVPRSQYRTVTGAALLAQNSAKDASRLFAPRLASEMHTAWTRMRDASDKAPGVQSSTLPAQLSEPAVLDCITRLREALYWDPSIELDGERPNEGARLRPAIHTIGYSLGGFVAQSVFMAWPFAVSSCTTICAGGSLRELAPTAFAHPEEWQTLLHSLRYELDAAMADGRLARKRDAVAGIEVQLYDHLQRVFYEIFEQEYRGSYQTRVSEYNRRLLFVVGGNDPIVRPRSVLDAAPPEGINLIEIAGLSHFLEHKHAPSEERAQREYWLPEIAEVISRFGKEAASTHALGLSRHWLTERLDGFELEDVEKEERTQTRIEPDGALPTGAFEAQLDSLVDLIASDSGYLFILRNELPDFMLDRRSQIYRAAALHHSDERIARYLRGLQKRSESLVTHGSRVTVVLPSKLKELFLATELRKRASSRSEASLSQLPTWPTPRRTWQFFQRRFLPSGQSARSTDQLKVLLFPAGPIDGSEVSFPGGVQHLVERARQEVHAAADDEVFVTALPDAWIWVGPRVMGSTSPEVDTRETAIERFCRVLGRTAIDLDTPDPAFTDDALADIVDFDTAFEEGKIRVVTVSRSAYNPRFRGVRVQDEQRARSIVFRAAMAIAMSSPFSDRRASTS